MTIRIPEEVQAVDRMTATIARLEAQKADLLEALKLALSLIGGKNVFGDEAFGTETEMIRAAIERNS